MVSRRLTYAKTSHAKRMDVLIPIQLSGVAIGTDVTGANVPVWNHEGPT